MLMKLANTQHFSVHIQCFFSRFLLIMLVFVYAAMQQQAFAQSRGGNSRGATVELEEAQLEQVRSSTTLPASIIVQNSHIVNAPDTGLVTLSGLKIGSEIAKGSIIGKMDTDEKQHQLAIFTEQLSHIELQLSQIEINLSIEEELKTFAIRNREVAEKRLFRAEQLGQKQVVTTDMVENATQSLISAEQQIVTRTQAQMRLEQQAALLKSEQNRLSLQRSKLTSEIADATLIAPITGQIVRVNKSPTFYAREGDVIVEIQEENNFEIAVDIPSELIRFIKVGQELAATTPSGQRITAKIRTILPQHNQRTGTRAIRLMPSQKLPLSIAAEGARLTVQIPDKPSDAVVTIAKDGLLPVSGGYVVFVANQGKAERRNVEIGGTVNGRILILSGVQTGEKIVIKGNENLSDGDALKQGSGKPKTPQAKAPPKPGDDAEKWQLSWQTRRGETTAELIISEAVSLYNGAATEVVRQGDNVAFTGEATLPFGIIELKFNGQIDGAIMAGTVTLYGLPNGNTPEIPFQGKRVRK